jgi:DNA-binding response OmpR family regulator
MTLLVVASEQRRGASVCRDLDAADFELDLVADGADAFRLSQSRSYEAIVLDLVGAREIGLDLCRRLRETRNWTPILALTASDSDAEHALLLDSGIDAYLAGPCSAAVLVAHVHALVRRNVHRF